MISLLKRFWAWAFGPTPPIGKTRFEEELERKRRLEMIRGQGRATLRTLTPTQKAIEREREQQARDRAHARAEDVEVEREELPPTGNLNRGAQFALFMATDGNREAFDIIESIEVYGREESARRLEATCSKFGLSEAAKVATQARFACDARMQKIEALEDGALKSELLQREQSRAVAAMDSRQLRIANMMFGPDEDGPQLSAKRRGY